MSQLGEHTDNHKAEAGLIPSNCWGEDVPIDIELINSNLLGIKNKIAPCKPRIIGVTKYYGLSSIINGYKAGLRDFGESRVLDSIKKIEALPEEIRKNSKFHFIGHLQTNKVEKAVEYFDYIQSVDSIKTAKAISNASCKLNKTIGILLQVNNAGEEQKSGYTKAQLKLDFPEIIKLEGIRVLGLMNMAPFGADENTLRSLFRDVKDFRDEIERDFKTELPELSMGMSDDYEIAVQEGATMIRIGRKLFT